MTSVSKELIFIVTKHQWNIFPGMSQTRTQYHPINGWLRKYGEEEMIFGKQNKTVQTCEDDLYNLL